MIATVSMIAMPFIVKYVTNIIKMLPVLPKNGWRVPALRAVVAVLSLLGAIGSQMLGEGIVDNTLIETTLLTAVNGVAATALYFYFK